MAVPTWREVQIADLVVPDPGWHYDDSSVAEKLMTSLRRHGQLRAVVARTAADGALEVVDGRRLLRCMAALGLTACMVADLGAVDVEAAKRLALDLELRHEVDYARLAMEVALLLESGVSADSLASAAPFSTERIGYFGQLARFDWSQFSDVPEGQGALSWDDLPELPVAAAEPALGVEIPAPDGPQASAAPAALESLPEAVFEPEPEMVMPPPVEVSPWTVPKRPEPATAPTGQLGLF